MATACSEDRIRVILRGDDFGFCHAANLAVERAFKEGVLTSTSLMTCTPWFEEAADICRRNPALQVGVHTTLTAEWLFYRWGSVLPATEVPSLVDRDGSFHPQVQGFLSGGPRLDEVEREIRAQVERALACGVDISYLDYHMKAAISMPAFEALLLRLAEEYRLPVSGYVGDERLPYPKDVPFEGRVTAIVEMLRTLKPGLWRMVTHPGLDVPEMQAIRPSWMPQGASIAQARASDTEILVSQEVAEVIRERRIQLVGYRDIR